MSDSAWKANEREFARWATEWVGDGKVKFGRNDARTNSDDRELNSDVDLIHPSLYIYHKFTTVDGSEKTACRGITAELTRRKTGMGLLYRWLDEAEEKSDSTYTYLNLNGSWLVSDRDSFAYFYRSVLQNRITIHSWLADTSVRYVSRETDFELLKSKAEQSRRYAESKGLFPIVVFRQHRKHQLVAVNMHDALLLLQRAGC